MTCSQNRQQRSLEGNGVSKECPPWLAGRRSLRLALEEDREQVIRKTGFIQCSRKFLFWGGRERGREGGREEGGREGGRERDNRRTEKRCMYELYFHMQIFY